MLGQKVKTDFEAGKICNEVAECIGAIAMGNQGLFEHSDKTGCYCFIPSTFHCTLKYYPGDIKLDPALCRAEELRTELFADPIQAAYLKRRRK